MTHIGPIAAFEDGRALAQAIVDTVREPLLVLDKELRVVAGAPSAIWNKNRLLVAAV